MAELLWTVSNLKPTRYTVLDFCKVVGYIIDAYNKLYVKDPRNQIRYLPAYPDEVRGESDDTPVDQKYFITYDITKREDGSLGPKPFSSKKERILRPRSQTTLDSGVVRTQYAKRFDNMVRFDCFAPTTAEANELIQVFEVIMEIHMSSIKSLGIDQITYEGRTLPLTFQRSKFRNRASLWYVRDELQLYRDENAIEQIDILVNEAMEDEIQRTISNNTNETEE